MDKKEKIKELNSKTLFHSRKNFGMFGNIQWSVEDIQDGTLIVRVSSSTKDWGGVQPDGRKLPPKEQIAENIKKSILHDLPGAKVKVNWEEWKPEHGKGFIMSVHGKKPEEAAKAIWDKLHDETDVDKVKTVEFSGDEFLQISEIAQTFLKTGAIGNPPKLVIFMGGVGSGKTTIRKQQFTSDFVHFEFGEIYTAVKKAVGEDNPKLTSFVNLACDLILRESIETKKNIVTEIIGDNKDVIEKLAEGMKGLGYVVDLRFIHCDPAEAYKRHLKAVEEDKDYLSAHFTQEATLSYFYHLLGLGPMPSVPEK